MTFPPPSRLRSVVDAFVKRDATGQERQRRWYLAVCLLTFVPTGVAFFIADLVAGRYDEAVPGLALVLVLIGALAMNRRMAEPRWAFRVTAATIMALFTWVVYLGAAGGYSFVWMFVLPPPIYYLLGTSEGTLWFLVSLALPVSILSTGLGYEYTDDIGVRFAVTYALVGLLAYSLERSRSSLHEQLMEDKHRLEVALGDVRTLSAMLPMCAWCRNVRDDDGYWSRIEDYLDRQTGTQVSHGLCPSCAIKLEQSAQMATEDEGAVGARRDG